MQESVVWEEAKVIIHRTVEKAIEELDGIKPEIFRDKRFNMELYTLVYQVAPTFAGYKMSEMYQYHGVEIEYYLRNGVVPRLQEHRGDRLLVELAHQWQNFRNFANWMRLIFRRLDADFVPYTQLPTLKDQGCALFNSIVFAAKKNQSIDAITATMQKTAGYGSVEPRVILTCIDILKDMDSEAYELVKNFERTLLVATGQQEAVNSEVSTT